MRRLLLNLLLAFVVALPLFIACVAVATWISPSARERANSLPTSIGNAAAGFGFWYLVMALPTGVFAIIHQLALQWPSRGTASFRLRSVVIAVTLALAAALYVGLTSLEVQWLSLLPAFVIPAAAFGWLVRPISPGRPWHPLANVR